MSFEEYGPLGFLIGEWQSAGFSGENQAPDPDRNTENTRFRQTMAFTPVGEVENHEQSLWALEYQTRAWEEGDDDEPFHQEVGYFIWDAERELVMKSFIVPRGISVNAGGTCRAEAQAFSVEARVGDPVYGISSNPFLDQAFRSERYAVTFTQVDANTLSYDEVTEIRLAGRDDLFLHTEKNHLKRC